MTSPCTCEEENVLALGALQASTPLQTVLIPRKAVGPHDVKIRVAYVGMCHSDLHQLRDDWHNSLFPMVPGHEIVGTVCAVGEAVTRFGVGDRVGVGCIVDSCRSCENCEGGYENHCLSGRKWGYVSTYNDTTPGDEHITYGGYSTAMVCDEKYVLRVPTTIDMATAAPLLCAGISVYAPIRHYNITAGQRVGVLGFGGLGHLAVKMLSSMGCHVTVISTSPSKEVEAKAMGADGFLLSSDADCMASAANSLHAIIDCVSADHELSPYIPLLKLGGKIVVVGAPSRPFKVSSFELIFKRLTIGGSLIGGIRETQEMLDFCGEHGIGAMVEVVTADYVNKALERLDRNDVRFRFVIDIENSLCAKPGQEAMLLPLTVPSSPPAVVSTHE